MPPRGAPIQRGGGRGGRGGAPGPSRSSASRVLPDANTQTVGVKRPGYGTNGRTITVLVNSYKTDLENLKTIHHYDVVIGGSNKTLPLSLNMELVKRLQKAAPVIFATQPVYDGRKNLFAPRALPFTAGANSQEFDVSLGDGTALASGKAPKSYKIRLTKVAEINPELLKRYYAGKQSPDNAVLTAITALNVVAQMKPRQNHPFNARSFFTEIGKRPIGSGLEIWRGYFQSVRPGIGQMLMNVDISSALMYKPGALIDLCLEFFGRPGDARILAPSRGLPDRERLRLERFISGVRVLTPNKDKTRVQPPRVIKKLTNVGADKLTFRTREGVSMTVAQYFKATQNKPLQFPDLLCVEVGSGALLPLELCMVPAGQQMRKQVPADKTKDVVEFSTLRPGARLAAIEDGLKVLEYGQSEYMREFGMNVNTTGPLRIDARVLETPMLKYGVGSKQLTIRPANGMWNMIDKRFYKPATIERWVVVVYETQRRFGEAAAQDLVTGFLDNCKAVGINVLEPNPVIRWENGQGNIDAQLRAAGMACKTKTGGPPTLIIIVLPEGGNDIYTAVKHFGDCTMGVATQCLKSVKCFRAKAQYYANVLLKINVKLGGINTIPDPQAVRFLTDPTNPTIVLGADVIHPAPGADGRPSFTSLVGNVDSDTAKYIAESRVQTSKQEMIDDLQEMAESVLTMYMRYREVVEKKGAGRGAPKRIIFYRDGVSEGQFAQVLSKELPALKAACKKLKINATITIVVVGKRHHVRFFPTNDRDADRSGNCPAGTVVDTEIAHPSEFDFFLQSHGGLLGTSRSGHYSVLYDENKFSADGIQALSFALTHVYARSTRSVSIPAPVYYADIVCARAKNHYSPDLRNFEFSDTATQADSVAAQGTLETFKTNFKPLHPNQRTLMYFS